MPKALKKTLSLFISLIISMSMTFARPIDRKAVVSRHNPVVSAASYHTMDTLNALTVGNGMFACTVDITGMQTLPENYANGMPVTTMSTWGEAGLPATLPSVETSLTTSAPYAIPSATRLPSISLRENPSGSNCVFPTLPATTATMPATGTHTV